MVKYDSFWQYMIKDVRDVVLTFAIIFVTLAALSLGFFDIGTNPNHTLAGVIVWSWYVLLAGIITHCEYLFYREHHKEESDEV